MRLALALVFAAAAAAQTLDLSGGWRFTTRDDFANARPAIDDSHWATVILPAGTKELLRNSWLRRTVVIPAGADTLAIGEPRRAVRPEVYINGERLQAEDRLLRLPPGLAGHPAVIAIRNSAESDGGSAFGWRDTGPWFVGPHDAAAHALSDARRQLYIARRPRFLLSGFFFALTLSLILLWTFTGRDAWILLWTALYLFNQGAITIMPGGQLMYLLVQLQAAVILQLGLVAAGLDGPRTRALTFGGIILAAVVIPGPLLSIGTVSWASTALAAAGTCLVHGLRRRLLSLAITANLVVVAWSSWHGAGVWVNRAGDWPLLTLLHIPPALAIVFLEIWRLAQDRRMRARLTSELEAARAVQQVLLPAPNQFVGIDAAYCPAAEVGGDFWQAFELSGAGRLVIIGDVSGKGLKAAMLVAVITGALQNRRSNSPALVLSELNAALAGRLNGGFVTVCAALIHPEGRITIANAGHPAPYLDGRELELPSGLPLGLVADGEYTERTVAAGRLTFISDGVPEAANAKGELFGFERTAGISTHGAAEIAEAARVWGQTDDITVVTIEAVRTGAAVA